jgi:hypothetical protein
MSPRNQRFKLERGMRFGVPAVAAAAVGAAAWLRRVENFQANVRVRPAPDGGTPNWKWVDSAFLTSRVALPSALAGRLEGDFFRALREPD